MTETTDRPTPPVIRTAVRCPECGRLFDLATAADAEEWAYGHDCEG